jgi:hypothetical protein
MSVMMWRLRSLLAVMVIGAVGAGSAWIVDGFGGDDGDSALQFAGGANGDGAATSNLDDGSFAAVVPQYRSGAVARAWFCPGVPGRDRSITGEIVVTNPADNPIGGSLTRFSVDGTARSERFTVGGRSTQRLDARGNVASRFVSTLVEVDATDAIVEQRTFHRAGNAVAQCAVAPAASWFVADGFSGADSAFDIVITNPALDSAIIDVSFTTAAGERSPQALKGFVVPGRSVRVLDATDLDARNETILAVSVRSTVGRVVVGRSQHYLGRGRLGYTMALAAAGGSARWYFASGEKGEGVDETFVVFNPGNDDAKVTLIITPTSRDVEAPDPIELTAPARRVTTYSTAQLASLRAGRYGVIISATSVLGDASRAVVVERVTTRRVDATTVTSVLLATIAPSTQWLAAAGAASTVESGLIIFNPGGEPATVSVSALGPAGDVAVTGYESIVIAPSSAANVTLPADIEGRALRITAGSPVVVERAIARGGTLRGVATAPMLPVVS